MNIIVSAAIKIKNENGFDLIVSAEIPARHPDIIHTLSKAGIDRDKMLQGFLTSGGEFLDRKTAGEVAIKAKQVNKLEFPPELYSKDLW